RVCGSFSSDISGALEPIRRASQPSKPRRFTLDRRRTALGTCLSPSSRSRHMHALPNTKARARFIDGLDLAVKVLDDSRLDAGNDGPERAAWRTEQNTIVFLSGLEERHISQLSGGQRQRVALARAIIFEPSALDKQLREACRSSCDNCAAGPARPPARLRT